MSQDSQDDNFLVTKVVEIYTRPTNTNQVCVIPYESINYCCDHIQLEEEQQFEISSHGLAYGITVLGSPASLLGWHSNFSQYKVEQYKFSSSAYFHIDNTVDVYEDDRVFDTLKLVQFEIRKLK